jgi:hypothetical protein
MSKRFGKRMRVSSEIEIADAMSKGFGERVGVVAKEEIALAMSEGFGEWVRVVAKIERARTRGRVGSYISDGCTDCHGWGGGSNKLY